MCGEEAGWACVKPGAAGQQQQWTLQTEPTGCSYDDTDFTGMKSTWRIPHCIALQQRRLYCCPPPSLVLPLVLLLASLFLLDLRLLLLLLALLLTLPGGCMYWTLRLLRPTAPAQSPGCSSSWRSRSSAQEG
jgi:hypothetical protein